MRITVDPSTFLHPSSSLNSPMNLGPTQYQLQPHTLRSRTVFIQTCPGPSCVHVSYHRRQGGFRSTCCAHFVHCLFECPGLSGPILIVGDMALMGNGYTDSRTSILSLTSVLSLSTVPKWDPTSAPLATHFSRFCPTSSWLNCPPSMST